MVVHICATCKQEFQRASALLHHFQRYHGEMWTCLYCGKIHKSLIASQSHMHGCVARPLHYSKQHLQQLISIAKRGWLAEQHPCRDCGGPTMSPPETSSTASLALGESRPAKNNGTESGSVLAETLPHSSPHPPPPPLQRARGSLALPLFLQ